MGKYNIDNIKKLILDVTLGMNAVKSAGADGKYDLADIQYILALLPIFQSLPNFGAIPGEIGDLDTVEAAELIAYVSAQFGNIGSDKTKTIIAESLAWVAQTVKLIQAIAA